eukprot:CAMPEP_0184495980 /NCGR_PEP_ID=MMETSP0113_2-20130426/32836_1 /TAXON_ID=91329 /ORGANISM="Norrisiella sphaerica, Strain BC52" /LENGTH=181 /DNA_ID=CAMNT_0026882421 /DNA_START=63 /DNA_END=605 /DNA_ORIENTATION=-
MDTARLKTLKRFLKMSFNSTFNQVLRVANIGGRRPVSKKETNTGKSEGSLSSGKEEVLEIVRETMSKALDDETKASTSKKGMKKMKMPSENAIEAIEEVQSEINTHLAKIRDVLPGYIKGGENLLEYIETEASLDSKNLYGAIEALQKACEGGEGRASSVPSSKREKHMDKVSKSLRSGRW